MAPHGTERRYGQDCRLPCCREAHRVYCAGRRELRRASMPEWMHGTPNGTKNYGCTCERCKAANTADCRPRVRASRERATA